MMSTVVRPDLESDNEDQESVNVNSHFEVQDDDGMIELNLCTTSTLIQHYDFSQ